MKRLSDNFLILVFLSIFFSCEKDDVCLEDMNINLNLGFYDSQTKLSKELALDSIVGLGKKPLMRNFLAKKVLLPLNIASNKTTFIFYRDQKVDTLYFEYNTKKQFVSKSCGFRVIFNNISCKLSKSPNIILEVEVSKKNITDEKEHIKSYFSPSL